MLQVKLLVPKNWVWKEYLQLMKAGNLILKPASTRKILIKTGTPGFTSPYGIIRLPGLQGSRLFFIHGRKIPNQIFHLMARIGLPDGQIQASFTGNSSTRMLIRQDG